MWLNCRDPGLSSGQDVVLMRALRDMNLPKFVFEDVPLFLGLISDLFPGLDCPRVCYPNFNDAVEQILQEGKYVILPDQVTQFGLKCDSLKIGIPEQLKDHWVLVAMIEFHHVSVKIIQPVVCAVCGARLTKWCRYMRRWWPDTLLWLWVQQVEESRSWSALYVKLRQGQCWFTSPSFIPHSWCLMWTIVSFISCHHQIGIAHQDLSSEPQSHHCHWTLRNSGPRHSRLDWRDLIQHLPRNQQAHWQKRAEVNRTINGDISIIRWLRCTICQWCHSFIHSYIEKKEKKKKKADSQWSTT